MRALLGGAFLAVLLAVLTPHVFRAGYSPDEEYTVFAVRGIAATGLPLLPSGLLYDRGVAYSFAARAAAAPVGSELGGGRAVSLACALAALAVLWRAIRRIAGEPAAWLAGALAALSVPFAAAATSARFYAPFLLLYLAVLAVLLRQGTDPPPGGRSTDRTPLPRSLALLFVLAALARLTHELAFTLAVVPAVCALCAARADRGRWLGASAAIAAGLAAAQGGLLGLHFLAPESGVTMIRRFFWWQVVNLLERPPLAPPVGLLAVGALAAVLLTGSGIRRGARCSAPVGASATAILLWGAATSLRASLEYPLDFFWHIAGTLPLLVLAVFGGIALRASGAGGAWSPAERALHLLWLGWVVFFGIIDSGITAHYLLVPLTLMLAALAVDLAAVACTQARRGRRVVRAAAVLAAAAVVLSTWGRHPETALASARPTIVAPAHLTVLAADAPLVACTDELACLLLAGRVDRWLALDAFLRERFVVSRRGQDVGVYAGRPATYRLADLFEGGEHQPEAPVLVVDVFKDLPVGPSSVFLERALRQAPEVQATTVIDTPHLRVVQVTAARSRHVSNVSAALRPSP